MQRGRLALLLVAVLVLIAACEAESPATPPPTPTPGAHFLMPTPAMPVSQAPYTPTPEMVPYIVQEGDTLYGIALRYGVTVEQLVEANNIPDPNNLSVGQELFIPAPLEPTETPSP
jgi:nucleoid-associated protein YgaU